MAYDGKNGNMYLAHTDGNNETVIDSRKNSFVGIVFIRGYNGFGLATYDEANGNLYFASYGNNTVVVVNGTTNSHIVYSIMNSVISKITIPYASSALGYDPANESVWVGTNATGGILSVISSSTNKASNFHLRFIPTAFAYDSTNQEMYVVSLPNEVLGLSYHCG
jgi:DNA-binding beta-propeller fold protein YncE